MNGSYHDLINGTLADRLRADACSQRRGFHG